MTIVRQGDWFRMMNITLLVSVEALLDDFPIHTPHNIRENGKKNSCEVR